MSKRDIATRLEFPTQEEYLDQSVLQEGAQEIRRLRGVMRELAQHPEVPDWLKQSLRYETMPRS